MSRTDARSEQIGSAREPHAANSEHLARRAVVADPPVVPTPLEPPRAGASDASATHPLPDVAIGLVLSIAHGRRGAIRYMWSSDRNEGDVPLAAGVIFGSVVVSAVQEESHAHRS